MTRLDHNRSLGEIALKADVPVSQVKNVIIWGSHSNSIFPDFTYATIYGNKIIDFIEEKYLKEEFIKKI